MFHLQPVERFLNERVVAGLAEQLHVAPAQHAPVVGLASAAAQVVEDDQRFVVPLLEVIRAAAAPLHTPRLQM